MTIVQLFLLELCVRYYPWTVQLPVPVTHSIPSSRLHDRVGSPILGNSSNNNPGPGSPSLGSGEGVSRVTNRGSRQGAGWYREHATYWGAHFWNWPTIGPYFLFLAVFTLMVGMSLLIIGNTPFYVALLGLAVCEQTPPPPDRKSWTESLLTKSLSCYVGWGKKNTFLGTRN